MAPTRDDLLITLGDYVDRGPDTRGVLDRLLALESTGRLIPLLGNHEQMMLDARDDLERQRFWRFYGGEAALASYAPADRPGELDDVPEEHWQFLARCRDYMETARHIFVHADVDPARPLSEQSSEILRWRKLTPHAPHGSGKLVVCGHTPQKSGLPWVLAGQICIDTWVYGDGYLTCLDVDTLDYWQANQQGHTRAGRLTLEPSHQPSEPAPG